MSYDPEALVDYKLAVLDAIRAELAERRSEMIVEIEIIGRGVPDSQGYVLRFDLSGDRLAALDEAWLRTKPGAVVRATAEEIAAAKVEREPDDDPFRAMFVNAVNRDLSAASPWGDMVRGALRSATGQDGPIS